MKHLFRAFIFLFVSHFGFGQKDQLVILTDSKSSSVVLTDFTNNYLSKIKALNKSLDINIKVIEVEGGIPTEVTSLPSFYYVNDGKKILYKGRYGTIDRIEAFIKNQRIFGFEPALLNKEKMFVWNNNGFQIGINTKITKLKHEDTSISDKDVYQAVFNKLKSSFKTFSYEEKIAFVEQSKLYYLNIYPYKSTSGLYYFSYEIFSQHNCIEPVYQGFKNPISGKYLSKVTAELAFDFESKLKSLVSDTTFKDGLFIPSKSYTTTSWKSLGIELNAQNSKTTQRVNYIINSGTYTYSKSSNAPIAFTFPPPVSQYAGTINEMMGEFSFDFSKIKGSFEVDFSSLDMGDESLNESVQLEQLLIKQFPKATISFKMPITTVPVFEAIPVPAQLSLMGVTTDQIISAEFKPISAKEIIVSANFSFNINQWASLEKPDGPSPQKETVRVYANFKVMKQ